ncbi:MAG TPA: serine/threonine-protein kinase [Ktedonobacterales bacterium]|jgi:serine/threonine protein kinase
MADRVGQQFGVYQLTSLLAESATAEIYRGEQRYSRINVVIKLLRRPLTTTEEIDTFRAEARALAALIHPHIARILGFDVQDQSAFLVMDYAPGGTLRRRYPGGEPVALETILPAIKQAADALQYAHEQGVIHQALRPENLLLGRHDETLLSGFYLAAAYQSADMQTPEGSGAIKGTAAYLAPEQFQGKPSPASDQYTLGVMVYEWLSGSLPFEGSPADQAKQHLTAAPPPLRGKAPTISPAVERVVMRTLAKDPAKRFASIRAFAAALEEAAQAEPVSQAGAASAAATRPASQHAAAAARPAAPQPARSPTPHPAAPYPPAGQMPTPQAWPRQPAAPQRSAQQPSWQPSPAAKRAARSNTVGCIIAIIVAAVIGLAYLLAH